MLHTKTLTIKNNYLRSIYSFQIRFIVLFALLISFPNLFAQTLRYALYDVPFTGNFSDGLVISKGNEIRNTQGNIAFETKYKTIYPFHNGLARIQTENEYGLINTKGHIVLEPKYEIYSESNNIPGFYQIKNPTTNKYGAFYKNKIIIPTIYDFIEDFRFPFVNMITKDNKSLHSDCINIITGEIFPNRHATYFGDIIKLTERDKPCLWYNKKGEKVNNLPQVSSCGLEIFSDPISGLIGIRHHSDTMSIVIPPKYIYTSPGWIKDHLWIENNKESMILDATGKVKSMGGELYSAGYLTETTGSYPETKSDLYTIDGDKIHSGKGIISHIEGNWFVDIGKGEVIHKTGQCLINAKTRKKYSGITFHSSEGMFCLHDGDKYYYVNKITGEKISIPGTSFAFDFHEGLAVVWMKDDTKRVINKKGQTIMSDCSEYEIYGERFSEGVISIYHKDYKYCYVYNPIQKTEYFYGQQALPQNIINIWMQKARDSFSNKDYYTSKDYYYQVMINDPENVSAIIGYGACLCNVGDYDGAIDMFLTASELEPENELAKKNLNIARSNKIDKEQQENKTVTSRRSQVWNGIGTFLNVLSNMSSKYSSYAEKMNRLRTGNSTYTPSNTTTNSNGSICKSCKGSGVCTSCHGDKKVKNSAIYNGGYDIISNCAVCKGSGKCGVCNGRGSIR